MPYVPDCVDIAGGRFLRIVPVVMEAFSSSPRVMDSKRGGGARVSVGDVSVEELKGVELDGC